MALVFAVATFFCFMRFLLLDRRVLIFLTFQLKARFLHYLINETVLRRITLLLFNLFFLLFIRTLLLIFILVLLILLFWFFKQQFKATDYFFIASTCEYIRQVIVDAVVLFVNLLTCFGTQHNRVQDLFVTF